MQDQRAAERNRGPLSDAVRRTRRRIIRPVDLASCFHKSFLVGDVLESTWQWLQTQQPIVVRWNEAFKSPVKSRPKIIWGTRNAEGWFPLYKWGQIAQDFGRVTEMPPQVQVVAKMIEDKFCHPAGYLNQALATFYWHGETQYIPAH